MSLKLGFVPLNKNSALFHDLLTIEYQHLLEDNPGLYYIYAGHNKLPESFARAMVLKLASGIAYKDAPSVQAVCQNLGLKYTDTDIQFFLKGALK